MFAALFGTLLGDRVTRREIAGIAIAAAGCAVLAGGDWQRRRRCARSATASRSSVRRAPRRTSSSAAGCARAVPLLPYLGAVNAIAAVALVDRRARDRRATSPRCPAHAYVACAGAALVASFVGHSLLNAAVRTTPTHLVALAVLGEPIGSSLITWAAFGEQPPIHAVIGGAIVLAGIAVGFVRR